MGQCWSRLRRRTKVNPLDEGPRGSDEVTENEPTESSSATGKEAPVQEVSKKPKPQVIKVKPSTNKDFSLRSLETNAGKVNCRPRKLPPLPSDVTRKTSCVYQAQENQRKVESKVEWDLKEFTNVANTVKDKLKLSAQANKRVVKPLHEDVSSNKNVEVKASEKKLAQDKVKWLGLVTQNTSEKDGNTASHEILSKVKEAQIVKEVTISQPKGEDIEKKLVEKMTSENFQNETSPAVKAKIVRKPSNSAELAHLAVKSQIFDNLEMNDDSSMKTSLYETKVEGKENEKQFREVTPYWKLQDVPIKPACLTNTEDVENGMKTIDSEMNALLKPEEKYRSVAFIVGKVDTDRSQTPSCVPQRLLKHQKAKADRVKLLEKQRDAERRRNANIAKRVQSAKHRSALKKPTVPTVHEAEREKTLQALKNHVSDKMKSANARRDDVIKQRVKIAKKSGSLRKQPEDESIYKNEVKAKVNFKMKGATDRRNEILNQKAHAAKKDGRTELVNEREKEIADVHKDKLEVKLKNIEANRERMLRRKLRSLQFQEKKRELARKTLARQRQEDEERCQTFFETETYDGDDDLGEHDWDFEDDQG